MTRHDHPLVATPVHSLDRPSIPFTLSLSLTHSLTHSPTAHSLTMQLTTATPHEVTERAPDPTD